MPGNVYKIQPSSLDTLQCSKCIKFEYLFLNQHMFKLSFFKHIFSVNVEWMTGLFIVNINITHYILFAYGMNRKVDRSKIYHKKGLFRSRQMSV